METTIVLFIISGLLGIINLLLGIGYKNMKDQIKANGEKAEKSLSKASSLGLELAQTKTNYVSRFNEVNIAINKVERSILAEIRILSENILRADSK